MPGRIGDLARGLPLALAAILASAGCSRENQPPPQSKTDDQAEERAVVVTVAPIERRAVQRRITVVGALHGWEKVSITPKVEGPVRKIYVDVGDRVAPGALLLEIDDTDWRLAVEEARRALEAELAKLGTQKVPDATFDIEALPSVIKARATALDAGRQFRREKELFQKKASSQAQFERMETELHLAEQTVQQMLLEAEATLASVRHRQSMLAIAQQRLKDVHVVAPALGRPPGVAAGQAGFIVTRRLVSEGEMVRAFPSVTALELVVDQVLKLRAGVPERYQAEVKPGQEVELQVEAYPDEVFKARVSRITPTIDSGSRTFEIEALVANEGRRLRPGGFGKVAILTRSDDQALTAPTEAISSFAGMKKIFVVREGKAVERGVELGIEGDGWREIAGDFDAAEMVVTSGQSQLVDGAAVIVRQNVAETATRNQP